MPVSLPSFVHSLLLCSILIGCAATEPTLEGPLAKLLVPLEGDAILSTSPGGQVSLGARTLSIQDFDFEQDQGRFLLVPIFDGEEGYLVLPFEDEEPSPDVIVVLQGVEFPLDDVDFVELGGDESFGLTGQFEDANGQATPVAAVIHLGAGSSTLRIEDDQAFLNGGLGSGTYRQIEYLQKNKPLVKTLVFEDVPGSMNDDINVQTGRLIRAAGWTTRLPSGGMIASGGVDLFCAGAQRIVQGGRIGVHSWGDPTSNVVANDLPRDHPDHHSQISYFSEMLPQGEAFYFYTLSAAPFDSVHWMNEQEIEKWGLATE